MTASSKGILSHFPYPDIRPVQADLLTQIERGWDAHDVFVVNAPTALGKTAIARTLMEWQRDVSYLVPTNQLLDQYLAAFPDTRTLRRIDSYVCAPYSEDRNKIACATVRAHSEFHNFCKGCPCGADMAQAKYRKAAGAYNFHIYMAQKLHRSALILDEAHQIIPFIQELASLVVWKHQSGYPDKWMDPTQLAAWVAAPATKKKWGRKKWYPRLLGAATSAKPQYVVREEMREWRKGIGAVRAGDPVDLPCLVLKPVEIAHLPEVSMVFPRTTSKIVLMSATIGPRDIRELGLSSRRVLYLNCASPIPPESRPLHRIPVAAVSYSNMEESTRKMAEFLLDVVAPQHAGERGLIHTTYQQSAILREVLRGDPRFLFHTKDNKMDTLRKFMDGRRGDEVLVASGLQEGLDLPYDLARWQVIMKVPWLSLGDPAIKYKADREPDWYRWETLKKIIQACGRVCRTPTDFGATLILDSTVERLLEQSWDSIPSWFRDVL